MSWENIERKELERQRQREGRLPPGQAHARTSADDAAGGTEDV